MSIFFGHKQLVNEVGSRLNRDLDRTTVYRWRQVLHFKQAPYDLSHVEALAHFGRLVGMGVKPERAKQITIQYMEEISA
jgi:hypothetical protein